jgi:hypothetical protein
MTTTITPGCFDEYGDGHTTHDNECHFCLEAQEEATRDFLKRQLGGNIGLNADWCVSAWHIYVDGEDRYLLDMEDGTYEVVTRKYREDDNDDIESVESFPESRLVEWVMRYKSLTTTQEHPCDACGVPVPEDEHLGHDKPNGDTEYLCEDCFNPQD